MKGFVYLSSLSKYLILSPRYSSADNFVGRPIKGYKNNQDIVVSEFLANALKYALEEFLDNGYQLVIYDGFRPKTAINDFKTWSLGDEIESTEHKMQYYPYFNKNELFKMGFISEKSAHARGAAIDISIIKIGKKINPIIVSERQLLNNQKILFLDDGTEDMGSSFDLFHEASSHKTDLVSDEYVSKRNFLKSIMTKHGFDFYSKEWWHYNIINEQFPNEYFDFNW